MDRGKIPFGIAVILHAVGVFHLDLEEADALVVLVPGDQEVLAVLVELRAVGVGFQADQVVPIVAVPFAHPLQLEGFLVVAVFTIRDAGTGGEADGDTARVEQTLAFQPGRQDGRHIHLKARALSHGELAVRDVDGDAVLQRDDIILELVISDGHLGAALFDQRRVAVLVDGEHGAVGQQVGGDAGDRVAGGLVVGQHIQARDRIAVRGRELHVLIADVFQRAGQRHGLRLALGGVQVAGRIQDQHHIALGGPDVVQIQRGSDRRVSHFVQIGDILVQPYRRQAHIHVAGSGNVHILGGEGVALRADDPDVEGVAGVLAHLVCAPDGQRAGPQRADTLAAEVFGGGDGHVRAAQQVAARAVVAHVGLLSRGGIRVDPNAVLGEVTRHVVGVGLVLHFFSGAQILHLFAGPDEFGRAFIQRDQVGQFHIALVSVDDRQRRLVDRIVDIVQRLTLPLAQGVLDIYLRIDEAVVLEEDVVQHEVLGGAVVDPHQRDHGLVVDRDGRRPLVEVSLAGQIVVDVLEYDLVVTLVPNPALVLDAHLADATLADVDVDAGGGIAQIEGHRADLGSRFGIEVGRLDLVAIDEAAGRHFVADAIGVERRGVGAQVSTRVNQVVDVQARVRLARDLALGLGFASRVQLDVAVGVDVGLPVGRCGGSVDHRLVVADDVDVVDVGSGDDAGLVFLVLFLGLLIDLDVADRADARCPRGVALRVGGGIGVQLADVAGDRHLPALDDGLLVGIL